MVCYNTSQLRVCDVGQTEFIQSAFTHASSVELFGNALKQLLSIFSTIITTLFELNDVVPNKPVACRQRKVDSMCSLRLKGILYGFNIAYELIEVH